MKLVHVSDIHVHRAPILGSDPISRFSAVLDHVAEFHADAERLVVTGDLTHQGHEDDYRRLATLLAAAALPESLGVRLLIGNHDDRANFARVFPDTPRTADGFVQWTDETSVGRFVYLDTHRAGTHAGHLCPARLRWLDARLADARRDDVPVWLFMHHNPVRVRVRNADDIGIVQLDELQSLLGANRDVIRHIFFGHCHFTLSGSVAGGIPFSAPRSTCHPCCPDFSGTPNRPGHGPLEPSYAVAFLDADETLVHTVDFERERDVLWQETDDSGWIAEGPLAAPA